MVGVVYDFYASEVLIFDVSNNVPALDILESDLAFTNEVDFITLLPLSVHYLSIFEVDRSQVVQNLQDAVHRLVQEQMQSGNQSVMRLQHYLGL